VVDLPITMQQNAMKSCSREPLFLILKRDGGNSPKDKERRGSLKESMAGKESYAPKIARLKVYGVGWGQPRNDQGEK